MKNIKSNAKAIQMMMIMMTMMMKNIFFCMVFIDEKDYIIKITIITVIILIN